MVELGSLPYPIATFILHKAQNPPRLSSFQCSFRVSSSRRLRRKNYLRPKILRTLTKPYPIAPVSEPVPENVVNPIELNVELPLGFGVEEELELSGVAGVGQVEVVGDSSVVGLNWVSGRTVFRVVGSFVGLFVLQTAVSVWLMGSGGSSEKGRNLRVEGGVELNENGFVGGKALSNMDELDEAKIAEIRKMAREARELEKKRLGNGGDDVDDVSDDEDDGEGIEIDSSKVKSGIVKEVDGKLTALRKKMPAPLLNVNFLSKGEEAGKEAKDVGVNGKEEVDRLMFETKRKFRSHLATQGDKAKGFRSVEHVRERKKNMDGEEPVNTGIKVDDELKMNGSSSSFSGKSNIGMEKDVKKPVSQSSTPLLLSKKRYSSNSAGENLGKGVNGSTTSGSDATTTKLSKEMNGSSNPERGVVQDFQRKMNDLDASIVSETHTIPRRNGQPDSGKHGSKLLRNREDRKHFADQDFWWSTLPYVFAILMQKGLGNEALQGFYTLRSNSSAENQSSYIVAFEDKNDARNFSYILDTVFGDLPDAAVDVVLMSTEELKETLESSNKKVIVARKGELQLYAGQPLAEAETALISLVR